MHCVQVNPRRILKKQTIQSSDFKCARKFIFVLFYTFTHHFIEGKALYIDSVTLSEGEFCGNPCIHFNDFKGQSFKNKDLWCLRGPNYETCVNTQ